MKKTRKPVLAVSILCLCAASAAFAAEGRREIFQAVFLDGTATAVQGKYFLSRNIDAPAGTIAIRVLGTGTEIVEIDLNGFTVTGAATGESAIDVSNVKALVLRNGSVRSPGSTSSAVSVSTSGIDGRAVIEDVTVTGGADGINLDVPNIAVRRCFIFDSAADGLQVTPASVIHGVIEDNTMRNVNFDAIEIGSGAAPSEGVLIRGNIAETISGRGLFASNSTGLAVTDNYFFGVLEDEVQGGGGIYLQTASSCIVRGNRTEGGGSAGIRVYNADTCLIANNTSSGNTLHGIDVQGSPSGGNQIVGNACNANGGSGILLWLSTTANVVRDNLTYGNTLYGIHFRAAKGCSDNNSYGGNYSFGNNGVSCLVPGIATCGAPDLCNECTGNVSFGDNLLPGPGPC